MSGSDVGSFNIGFSPIGVLPIVLLSQYLDLITSEHNQKPKYMAMLAALFQPMVDGENQINALETLFDLDTATGVNLDIIGIWIGRSRNLQVPITGVYFTFDIGPGFDIGIFKGPFDPISGLVALPDEQYRTLLKATAARNQWDGTITGAYAAYAILFTGTPFQVYIYDYQDMTMSFVLGGGIPDALTQALFTEGYLSLKPDGVGIREYVVPGVVGPMFAFDTIGNPDFAGFDQGAFGTFFDGDV